MAKHAAPHALVMAKLTVLIGLFVVHTAVTVKAMLAFGFIGIFRESLANWGTGQVFSDLTVCLLLINGWLLVDSKKSGVPAWPFVLASLPLGSIAPLSYLVLRELRTPE